MSIQKVFLATVFLGMAATAFAQNAQESRSKSTTPNARTYLKTIGPLTSKQRGEMARDFVARWGNYFQHTYKQPVGRWALKQAYLFGTADADNLRNAMRQTSMEAAMMAMRGETTDNGRASIFEKGMIKPRALGDLASDLVFMPLSSPCRIFDTRNAGGQLSSGGTRHFDTFPFGTNTNFAYQGGTATGNCGISADAAAVVLNIAAPLPISGGFLTVYPYGTTRPLASHLDYTAGELKNNEIIAVSGNSTFDITVYAHGQTHVVGDVTGYFIRSAATALECQETANTNTTVAAGGTANSVAPACPAGYTQTATNCESSTWKMPFVYFQSGTCSAQNNDTAPATLRASRTCCRVPGR